MAIVPYNMAHAEQSDYNWANIDRIGLLDTDDERHLGRGLWRNVTQEETITALDRLPYTLQSSAYRELVKRLLLSTPSQSREDIGAPSFLTKRVERLIAYGLFEDAKLLLDKATADESQPEIYELAITRLLLELYNRSLSSICLDVQASAEMYRDMPKWRELHNFCRLRFGGAEKIKLEELQFNHFPELKIILTSGSVPLNTLKTTFGTLVTFRDQKIDSQNYNDAAREIDELSDLTVRLALDEQFADNETYQCYAIEAADRGLITTDSLIAIYKNAVFSETDLNHNRGEVTLHPCHVPAYFYQRLSNAGRDSDRIELYNIAMTVTKSVPLVALIPLQETMNTIEMDKTWRMSVLTALADENVSDDLLPIQRITQSESINQDQYQEWLTNAKSENNFDIDGFDIAAPLYFSQILSGEIDKLRQSAQYHEYGNFFSLTYTEKPLVLGLGFKDYFADIYQKNNDADYVTALLEVIGGQNPTSLHIHEFSVILSSLQAYKLEKEAIALTLEYLQ